MNSSDRTKKAWITRKLRHSYWAMRKPGTRFRAMICKTCLKDPKVSPLANCPIQHKRFYEKWSIRRRERLRIEILTHYGGKCACCGFDNLSKKVRGRSFLEIDHIAGGGQKHGIKNICYWLKRNGFPTGFRVLCASCNVAMEPNAYICEYHSSVVRNNP